MEEVILRLIEQRDNKDLAKIIRTVFEEFDLPKEATVYSDPTTDSLYELFSCDGAFCYVAEKNGKIIGGGGVYPTKGLPEGYCEFSKFYLSEEARGFGIGKTILNKCIDGAKNLGYKNLYLESFPGLNTALELYKKTGFKYIDKPLGESGHDACSIWQQLEIA